MNITFIGGGNMAGALIGGLLAKGTCEKEDLRVVEINSEARVKLAFEVVPQRLVVGCSL